MEYDDSYKYQGDRPGHNWGDYQFTDHGYDQLAADPTSGIQGKVPGIESLVATEQRGRLQFVRSDLKSALIQALAFTQLTILDPGPPAVGKAVPMLTGGVSNWFSEAVAQGNVVLMDIEAAKQGEAAFVLCKQPEVIAKLAFAGYKATVPTVPSGMAIIDGPPQIIDAAVEMSKPAPITPTPSQTPVPQPAQASAPSWMLPAVIGLGALGVVALVVTKRKR